MDDKGESSGREKRGNGRRKRSIALDFYAEELEAGALENAEGALDSMLEESGKLAAGKLAEAMLTAKFIQGLPVVGAISNLTVYQKICGFAFMKYKKRFLKTVEGVDFKEERIGYLSEDKGKKRTESNSGEG